ncbi:hypothetical protein [Marinomonas transparens]|uniref:hypothetical protein n=1 Tax=Marinomonas transparens TaxID=2795388 RepID=UPI003F69E4A0
MSHFELEFRGKLPIFIKMLSLVFEENGNKISNLQTVYRKILKLLHSIEPCDNFLNQIRLPKLTDKELLSLSLAVETLGIDSEHFLFKRPPPQVHGRIERSVYNRRVRKLSFKLEDIRQKMVNEM